MCNRLTSCYNVCIQISKGGAAEATGALRLGDKILEVRTCVTNLVLVHVVSLNPFLSGVGEWYECTLLHTPAGCTVAHLSRGKHYSSC